MIEAGIYFLKVFLCSALLCGYYFLALRNTVFHQWNRFYLLGSLILSLVLPVAQFTILQTPEERDRSAIALLQVVSSGDEEAITASYSRVAAWQNALPYVYASMSVTLLVALAFALLKVFRLSRSYQAKEVDDIFFFNTDVPGTPFSFFKYIFWNKAIDIESNAGTRIFRHELVHVREWHTLDKLFVQVVIALFWWNPVFWLIRYELRLIHEFIADNKAVEQQDASQLAALILQTAYPGRFAQIINPFFHQSIKRRLLMLTKIGSPRMAYASRLFILPLLALVVVAFSVKTETLPGAAFPPGNKITVLIDAGHGGSDGGVGLGSIMEKDLTLAIAKEVQKANRAENIEILLTRSNDDALPLKQRAELVRKGNADLLVSIHINATALPPGQNSTEADTKSGFGVVVQDGSTAFGVQSQLLGSSLLQSIRSIYQTDAVLTQAKNKIYLLNTAACPAVMVECGYFTNAADRAFIQNPANQKKIAQQIMDGISRYLLQPATTPENFKDTVPNKKEVKDVAIKEKSVHVTYVDGTSEELTVLAAHEKGIIDIATKKNKVSITHAPPESDPLVMVNGKRYGLKMSTLIADSIKSVNVLKGPSAIAKYGKDGERGVIEVTTLSTVEELLTNVITATNAAQDQLVAVQKQVLAAHQSQNVAAERQAIAAQKQWAATENKTVVQSAASAAAAERVIQQAHEMTFSKVEVEPQFPGGLMGWRKYLEQNLQKGLFKGAPKGTYSVGLDFNVERDGSVTGIQPLTKFGFGLEEEATRLIKDGPKWAPGKQNGHTVRVRKRQTVTFVIP